MYSTIWLSEWSTDATELLKEKNMTEDMLVSGTVNKTAFLTELQHLSFHRIWIYLSIGGGEAVAIIVASFALAIGCLSASSTLHSDMLWAIMKAPMSFFDSTPLGRLINR